MRPIERIPVFLEKINGKLTFIVVNIWKINNNISNIKPIYKNKEKIKEFWLKNPDLRFSQVLINLGIVPNISGFWYYLEEDEILEKLEIPQREYLLWGQNYDKDMNILPKTIYKPIKDLDTDHIQAILDGNFCKSEEYKKCFEEELKLREDGNT